MSCEKWAERNLWNGIGAAILFMALLVGTCIYVECIHPERMAGQGYVEAEGGRFLPVNTEDPRIDALEQNYVGLVTQLKDVVNKLQRQITVLKQTKKDK
jgi:hypothetical protein